MSIFSLVVARKDSKGLKNKVVQKIHDKYVFEYSIEYSLGLSSKIKREVLTVVSSNSEIIEQYCKENSILFTGRKPHLASDVAQIEDVVYDTYEQVSKEFKYISLLYGNIPTRYSDEFLRAFEFLESNPEYDAALSMQNVEKYNPAWMFELKENALPPKSQQGYRRQDLKQYMIHDGHTILTRSSYFMDFMKKNASRKMLFAAFGKTIKPILNSRLIIDIDTEKDLKLTEAFLRNYEQGRIKKG